MDPKENTYCHYSDLPSPMAYMQTEEEQTETKKENLPDALQDTKEIMREEISHQSDLTKHA